MKYVELVKCIKGIRAIAEDTREKSVKRDNILFQTLQKQGLYLETFLEYNKRFWFIPQGLYFGRKIFAGIYNRKFNEMEEEAIKAGKEVQKKEEEMRRKIEEQRQSTIIRPQGGRSVALLLPNGG